MHKPALGKMCNIIVTRNSAWILVWFIQCPSGQGRESHQFMYNHYDTRLYIHAVFPCM